ncbi:MAG: epoxide hydrolase [Pseudomonadota bacterium]
MTSIHPFELSYSLETIRDLKDRLRRTRLPETETVADWTQGVPKDYISKLAAYWLEDYDFAARAERMNRAPHFMTKIDGLDIHFVHQRSSYPNARALLITHGWPGSVLEFLDIIDPLTDPLAHGGASRDAFHVICPSLPGFGYSSKPTEPGWGPARIARTWDALMAVLGYDAYYAQGGDWGSRIARAIGEQNLGRCRGLHLNYLNIPIPKIAANSDLPEDRRTIAELDVFQRTGMGYAIQQSTRPQTLGYALTDSPVGQLAWIVEKFQAWSDCDGHPENAFSIDEMLDHVTLYWMTASAASSARLYWERAQSNTGDQETIDLPVGYSLFPKEITQTPKSWAESYFNNLVYFNTPERGGHFAASEQPDLFVKEVRDCFARIEDIQRSRS